MGERALQRRMLQQFEKGLSEQGMTLDPEAKRMVRGLIQDMVNVAEGTGDLRRHSGRVQAQEIEARIARNDARFDDLRSRREVTEDEFIAHSRAQMSLLLQAFKGYLEQ